MDRRIQEAQRAKDYEQVLLGKVRTGEEVTTSTVVQALQVGVKGDVLALIDQANVPETEEGLQFLRQLKQHDKEARATLDHYELVQEGDVAPPDMQAALKALMDHLQVNPHHLEAINNMHRPVYQLVPVYDHEGAGFRRLVNAIDAHVREGQGETYVRPQLQNVWEMITENTMIVDWQVVVTEGKKELAEKSTPFLGNGKNVLDVYTDFKSYCEQQGLQLCSKESYSLLQMQQIRQSPSDTLIEELGIDTKGNTLLSDDDDGNMHSIPIGAWDRSLVVAFSVEPPGNPSERMRFRPSVVVKVQK